MSIRILSSLAFLLYLSSCTTSKQLQVLQGEIDSGQFSQFRMPEQRVQKGDQMSITVFSDNAAASAMFNSGAISSVTTNNLQLPSSGVGNTANVYEVDGEGMIYFPQIGRLKIEGLTKEGINALLSEKLSNKYLSNPYFVINFLNLRVTVFGDVNKPGVYPLTRANTNIFEALTLAGDLTYYAKRENILVIREQDGKRVFARIDLTKPDVFNSPYYFLQQNDMVFVDMRKDKINSVDQTWLRNTSVLLSILTTTAILINIFR